MTTAATLFTGGGGVDIGMRAAGYDVLWGIENDERIADVARVNGVNVTTADILETDPADFAWVDYLHASPPCPNFSVAKQGAKEMALDIALSGMVSDFIAEINPRFFTLENVSAYQYSESFAGIVATLARLGYMFRWQILNAADFGVPQTRRRLWLIAVRDGFVPYLPQPVPWVGWYEAIADLVPALPDSQFAPWQLERLPAMWRSSLLFPATGHTDGASGGLPRYAEEPAQTLRAQRQGIARAFIIDDQNNGAERDNGKRGLTLRNEAEPVFTVSATQTKRILRAAVPGRVVAMTVECLARFQSFPDSYALPENNALACRIIGNAVPPLVAQRIAEVLQ